MSTPATAPISIAHGSSELQVVTVDAYNAELRDGDGFIGDRASNRAFRAILDESRERIREATDEDPLGDTPTEELPKKKMDKLLVEGEPEAAGVIHGAIEEFATELSTVITRFLKLKAWRDTERIVVGGGLRSSRVGELAIGRTSVLLKEAGHKSTSSPFTTTRTKPGCWAPSTWPRAGCWRGTTRILAVDIGGSNLRAGLVELRPWKASKKGSEKDGDGGEIARGTVDELELWRYADEKTKPSRKEAVERIGAMLERLIKRAGKNQVKLAPFIGVGCPGIIAGDGRIERGGQNLPGNWESSRFNLPEELHGLIPKVDGHETLIVMHNDAVVHGLSDLAYVQDVDHWGVLTIGTGLGNARFTNKKDGGSRK